MTTLKFKNLYRIKQKTDSDKIFPVDVTCKSTTKYQLTKSKGKKTKDQVNVLITHVSILAWEIPGTEEPGGL